jgi:hypothetical protein
MAAPEGEDRIARTHIRKPPIGAENHPPAGPAERPNPRTSDPLIGALVGEASTRVKLMRSAWQATGVGRPGRLSHQEPAEQTGETRDTSERSV